MRPFLDGDTPLAEIARYLPQKIQEKDNEVRILVPRFGVINERRNRLHEVVRLSGMNITIDDNDNPLTIKVASIPNTKMQVYFLDNEDFFHRKFVAEATTGAWYYIYYPNGYNATGQYMGTDPYTSSLSDCNDRDAGCSRPRFAYCEKQSTVHDVAYYYANPTPYYIQPGNNYYAKAVAKHEVWGVTLIEQVTNRGLAGSMPSSSVDYEKLKSLSLEGRTNSKVSGNITTENKELICDINGQIQMPVNQDFFVSFKVILFVEDKSLTNEQAEVNEQQVRGGHERLAKIPLGFASISRGRFLAEKETKV